MRLKTALRLAAPLALAASLAATAASAQDLKIATSLGFLGFPFFVHMQNELNAEAEALGGIETVNYDGQNQTTKQTADVEAAIVSGVSGLVISPLDSVAMAPAVKQAVDAGIPVVTIDRRVDGVDGHPRPCRRRQRQGRRGAGAADHRAVPGRRRGS